ncbi:tyrosine-type recombinase/integrase [Dactylosporangium sp. NPDC000521]|uniref:tyrosine-type recombinase/integrase n=1 Tax=Dactylosporangium sp. NPDC000521 TaxID=3363975 RepID=UPI0036CF1126
MAALTLTGLEEGPRCVEPVDELHVVQQLRYSPKDYDTGFLLPGPAEVGLEGHRRPGQRGRGPAGRPPQGVRLGRNRPDRHHRRRSQRGTPQLLFSTRRGNPFTDRTWSREWGKWRAAAGWPDTTHARFHALRHFFATVLITDGAEPQDVQRAILASGKGQLKARIVWKRGDSNP